MIDLRVERAKRRLSQQAVADAVGISRQAYNRIENERATPKFETAVRISKALEFDVTELLKER